MTLLAAVEHPRHERAHAVDDAVEVHAEDPPPVRERGVVDAAPVPADPGVVAEHVHRAERLEGARGERVHALRVRDVGLDGEHFRARVAQLGCGRLEGIALDIGEDDAHALLGEALRQSAPDPARRAGDDRHAALELLHRASFRGARRYEAPDASAGGDRRMRSMK